MRGPPLHLSRTRCWHTCTLSHPHTHRSVWSSQSGWERSQLATFQVWDFGDGYFSFDENAVHTYNAPGNYTITLSALTNDGCLLDSIYSIVNVVSTTTFEEDNSATKKLIKITDVLGREVVFNSNQTLFYQFNDGTTEKKIVVE